MSWISNHDICAWHDLRYSHSSSFAAYSPDARFYLWISFDLFELVEHFLPCHAQAFSVPSALKEDICDSDYE